MLNTVRGVAAGGVILVGVASLILIPTFLFLGPDKVLVGSSLQFNDFWTGMALVVSLLAAGAAGWTAHRVSGGMMSVFALAALVVAFGLGDAVVHHWLIPQMPVPREGLTGMQMLLGLKEPLWYDLSGPVMMATFIWVAGSSRHTETLGNPAGRSRTR
jgi:hypothetical protein